MSRLVGGPHSYGRARSSQASKETGSGVKPGARCLRVKRLSLQDRRQNFFVTPISKMRPRGLPVAV